MNRSGYDEYCDDTWLVIRWRGAVNSALKGKRGQAALKDLISALDAMTVKELHPGVFAIEPGHYCALGILGTHRGKDMTVFNPGEDDDVDFDRVCETLNVSNAFVREVMYINDQNQLSPAMRWQMVRDWAMRYVQND